MASVQSISSIGARIDPAPPGFPLRPMNEHNNDHEQHPPRWVPYTPPAPDGWDRVRMLLRRLSFPVVVVLLGAGLAGALYYWSPTPEPTNQPASSVNVLVSDLEEGEADGVGQLRVQSAPAGATVRVNGDSVGVTPFLDSTRQAGVYMLSVQRAGHFRADTVVVLDDGAAAAVRFALRPRPGYDAPASDRSPPAISERAQQIRPRPVPVTPTESASPPSPAFGAVYVTSVPTGAVVTVDGAERGRTPLPLSKLPPGPQRLAVSLDGYQSWTGQVNVRADTTARVHAKLRPRTGRLRVLARPWGTIYINDTLHARERDVWYETDLPAGAHQVTVVHPVLGKQTQAVEVQAGEEASVVVDLRTPASSP